MGSVTLGTYKVTDWDTPSRGLVPVPIVTPKFITWNDPPSEAPEERDNPLLTLVSALLLSSTGYSGIAYKEAQEEYHRLLAEYKAAESRFLLKCSFGSDLVYHVNSSVWATAMPAWGIQCQASTPAQDADALTDDEKTWIDQVLAQVA